MANLLGGEYCIESLRQDVKDLQEILDEVHSRVGQVKYQSWKFPDKSSCDVDVTNLLDRCQYNELDEEECQMSHVMLYDVVIDRMVYLLQSFICFNEILLNTDNGSMHASPTQPSKKKSSMRSMSIGLTVKKCWGRITQIAALLQKLAKEVNARRAGVEINKSAVKYESNLKSGNVSTIEDRSDLSNDKDVSCDVRCIGCQTAESAYTTCETCSRAQGCLHDVGRAIVDLCRAQSLPTALEDYQTRCQEGILMSVADLVRWCKHQSKDLSRISRHMTSLTNQVTPLKADLSSARKAEQNVKTELQLCRSVFDRKEEELREEFRRKEYRTKEVEKDLRKKVSTLESIKAEMQEEIDKCKWKISDLKDELLQKHRDHLAIENTMSQLKEEAVEGQQYKKDAVKFKKELARLHAEAQDLQQSLNHDRQLYESEQTKNGNLVQREKMLQDKQRSLLHRMETMNEELEKMREQTLTLEEDRDDALAKLEGIEKTQSAGKTPEYYQDLINVQKNENELLRQTVESLRSENGKLTAALDEYAERERLIVAYPDLNQNQMPSPVAQGSGDILVDIKSQVDANRIRIEILEKENDALMKTLDKVSGAHEENTQNISSRRSTHTSTPRSTLSSAVLLENFDSQLSQPIQLWNTSGITYEEDQKSGYLENSLEASLWEKNNQSKSPFTRWESARSKPPSGRSRTTLDAPNKANRHSDVPKKNGVRMGSDTSSYSSTSVEAYKKIKQQQFASVPPGFSATSSFTVGTGRRPKSGGRPSSAKSALFKPWT